METFIDVYDNALSTAQCNTIIDWFEKSTEKQFPGECGNNKLIDTRVKNSTDISLQFNSECEISQIIFPQLRHYVIKYIETYNITSLVSGIENDIHYTLQKYKPNQGYFGEHCEHDNSSSSRVLGWTLYLNDIVDGGATYYTKYDLKISAKTGRLVIFPAYWTHAHKGLVSLTETKYISTGWFTLT